MYDENTAPDTDEIPGELKEMAAECMKLAAEVSLHADQKFRAIETDGDGNYQPGISFVYWMFVLADNIKRMTAHVGAEVADGVSDYPFEEALERYRQGVKEELSVVVDRAVDAAINAIRDVMATKH